MDGWASPRDRSAWSMSIHQIIGNNKRARGEGGFWIVFLATFDNKVKYFPEEGISSIVVSKSHIDRTLIMKYDWQVDFS